jgi:hypothetical protein
MLRSGPPIVDTRRSFGEALDQATADATERRRFAEIEDSAHAWVRLNAWSGEHARFLRQALAAHPVWVASSLARESDCLS